MKNKLRKFLLILLVGIFTIPVLARADCTPEAMQDKKKALQEIAAAECDNMKSAAETYNSLAADFISSCDKNLQPTSVELPSKQIISAASQAGADISDPSLYQYRGVQWHNANFDADNKNCAAKQQQVINAGQAFENAIQLASKKLYDTDDSTMSVCTCDENGQNPSCSTINPQTQAVENQKGGCMLFTALLNSLSGCPLCKIFEVILNTDAEIAHISWEATSGPLTKTVSIFFLVLLALEALKAVASVGGLKPSAFIKNILLLGLKIAIVISLLSSSRYIYGYFISPVLKGGLDMGLAIAQSAGGNNCAAGNIGSISSQEFDPDVFNNVLTTVQCFGQSAATIPAVGMGLICNAFADFPPSLSMFISGFLMMFFGLMIWLAFSFYLIDATVQLGMLSAMVPFLIACWPFAMTKRYVKKGVDMLMNTFFTFALTGSLLLLGSKVITASISSKSGTGIEQFINAINNSDVKQLEAISALDGMHLLMLIACGIFAMKLIANLGGLAGQFASGAGMSSGAKLGGMATAAATGAAKWAGSKTAQAGGAALKAASDKSGLTDAAKKGMNIVQQHWGSGLAAAGRGMGLGRFQNQNAGTGVQTAASAQEQNRPSTPDSPDTQQGGQQQNQTTDDNNNTEHQTPDSDTQNQDTPNEDTKRTEE